MKFEYSSHWEKQKQFRSDITDDIIELCIRNATKVRDREWENAWNAIAKIPPSGRTLKVVYKNNNSILVILTT